MEEYRGRVFRIVEMYGGRYVVIGGPVHAVEGEWRPVFPVMIEFPGTQEARRWYDSEEYREPKQIRLGATRGSAVLMEGL